jgi:general secretion pathway protein A
MAVNPLGLTPVMETASLDPVRRGFYSHFKLKEAPFRDTVNPRFLFRTPQYERSELRLKMFLEEREALALISGPSGCGKSLFMQCLLDDMDSRQYIPISLFASPGMTITNLLYEILYELDAPVQSFRKQVMIEAIQEKILLEAESHRRIVIFLDEAHFLSSSALHLLRTLTNLESRDEKMISVILFAEDSFLRRLKHRSYDSLRSRVGVHVSFNPLDREQSEQYIKFRMLVAGGRKNFFTDEAYARIYDYTKGVPRLLSRITSCAMQESFLDELPVVDCTRVERAIERMV